MKLKKLFLLMPMLFSMTACNGGEKSYAGTYSFQLGSNTGTHAGIHLTLTDDLVPDMENPAKKFSIEFDVGGKAEDENGAGAGIFSSLRYMNEILAALDSTDIVDADKLEDYFNNLVDNKEEEGATDDKPITINGYYQVVKGEDRTNLEMGITFNDYGFTIPEEIVKMVMYATISDDTVTVVIPVSIRSFLFQLYWYGYRIAGLSSLADPVYLPDENPMIEPHDIGTHPTAKDVKKIQEYQQWRSDNTPTGYETGEFLYINYYNYHTLSMGLIKDGK